MPIVYRVLTDDRFQSLESVDKKAYLAARQQSWRFDGSPIETAWEPLEVYVRRTTLKKPDIWGVANTLAFEDSAAAIVQFCLDQAGEEFSLVLENRKLIVLNVTYTIDAPDKSPISENGHGKNQGFRERNRPSCDFCRARHN